MLRAADWIALTHTGLQRRENEDAVFAQPPAFVVADGMGGAQAGEVASKIAVDAFAAGLPDHGSAEERLAAVAMAANRKIYELSRSQTERAGMGTTLTAAYLGDNELSVAHVGDSRAYLFRDGTLERLTEDHSLMAELIRRGKLTEEEAADHPQRSIITRALGPEPDVTVDTRTKAVRAGDVVLLCSDGLTSMIAEAKVEEVLRTIPELDRAAQALIDEANRAGGRDNITVVLFRLEDVGGSDGADQPTVVAMPTLPPPGAGPNESGPHSTVPHGTVPPETVPEESGPRGSGVAVVPVPPPTIAPASTAAPPPTGAPTPGGAPPPAGAPPPEVAPPPQSVTGPRSTVRPAPIARPRPRSQHNPPGARRGWRYSKPVAALLAVVIVLFLFGGGGYLASRQLFFIGTDSQGFVTIYRGLPYDLPAGVRLYETYYESGVPASTLSAAERARLLNHDLRSQASAQNLVNDLELGKVQQ
jgi:protein phosphatase